jgi:hypothetical protein
MLIMTVPALGLDPPPPVVSKPPKEVRDLPGAEKASREAVAPRTSRSGFLDSSSSLDCGAGVRLCPAFLFAALILY